MRDVFPVPAGHFDGCSILMTQYDDGLDEALAAGFIALGAMVAVIGEAPDGIIGLASPTLDDAGFDGLIGEAGVRLGGPVDILINNRWRKPLAPAETLGWAAWRDTLAAVVDTAFLAATAFARARLANGGGAVLNFIDNSAINGGPGVAPTAAAHAGLENLTRTLAVEWAADDIRVNAISCGLVQARADPAFRLAARRGANAGDSVPLGRVAEPGDIVSTALFLCSRYAAYVTGATFTIDGGEWLRHTLGGAPFTAPRDRMRV